MGSEVLNSNGKTYENEEKDVQKISVFDQFNGIQSRSIKSDSFIVDMERLSPLPEKETNANSRVTRTLSRKASIRGGEKKTNLSAGSEATTSPRAALQGFCTPEKAAVVTTRATPIDHPPLHNHQITITTGNGGTTAAENKGGGKRLSFRRSSTTSWAIDPRRILLFFATLSSIGTILLIYFTLSVGKLNTDENALN